jgi:hypothetical protein
MKRSKQRQKRPAEAVATYPPLRSLETFAREAIHLKKVIISEGREAAVAALEHLTLSTGDPSDASMMASARVTRISNYLDSGNILKRAEVAVGVVVASNAQ